MAASSLYLPLPTPTSTRVLSLDHGPDSAPLCASLAVIDVLKYPRFDALSYTWGSSLDTEQITIDGHAIRIRKNLHDFLLQLRRQGKKRRPIWIDAISISQTDLLEKGQQVQMIGDIFAAAQRVLVWTGLHAGGSEGLFEKVGERSSVAGQLGSTLKTFGFGHVPNRAKATSAGCSGAEDEEDLMRAWVNFINRPYFSRLWIIQELALAQSLVVYCGNSTPIDWHTLIESGSGLAGVRSQLHKVENATIMHQRGDTRYGPTGAGMLDIITALRHSAQKDTLVRAADEDEDMPAPRELIMLSREFQAAECADRRDRVYALLSLEKLPETWTDCGRIPVDYTVEVSELFLEVCRRRLRVTKPPIEGNDPRIVGFEDVRRVMKGFYGQPVLLESRHVEVVSSMVEGLVLTAEELEVVFGSIVGKIMESVDGEWKWWCYLAGCVVCALFVEGEKWESPSRRMSTAIPEELRRRIETATLLDAIASTRQHLRDLQRSEGA